MKSVSGRLVGHRIMCDEIDGLAIPSLTVQRPLGELLHTCVVMCHSR